MSCILSGNKDTMMIYSGMILNLKELQWEAGWIRHGEGAVVKKKKSGKESRGLNGYTDGLVFSLKTMEGHLRILNI